MRLESSEEPKYRQDRPRPTSDICRSYGNIALKREPYELTEHDAQFAAYDGYPNVQADVSDGGYEHGRTTVDRPL